MSYVLSGPARTFSCAGHFQNIGDQMTINKTGAAFIAALISTFPCAPLYASSILFKVDLSANIIESTVPGGTVFHDSKPLFGTTIDPIQNAELLHISDTGVNASG